MFGLVVQKLWLPALGVLLIAGAVVQSPNVQGRLGDWVPASRGAAARTGHLAAPAPSSPPRVVAEGRVVAYPGAEVIVGTEAAGLIVKLTVQEKSVVRKGDLIAELNSADLRASRDQAVAQIAEAEADVRYFEREARREEALIARRAGTLENLDVQRRGLDAACARRAAAIASRDRFEALIAKTRIIAPIDGVVTARHVQPGETVDVNARMFTIADLSRVRIEAEVDEYDTGRVALGAPVSIVAEGFPGAKWRGSVEEIPDTVVGRRLRPEDPGRPIDSRVLPVKIAFGEPTPLKLGQRVEVEVAQADGAAP
jgi:HlyD family secretion protein